MPKKVYPKVEVECSVCKKKWMKTTTNMKKWSGMCRLCSNIAVAQKRKSREKTKPMHVEVKCLACGSSFMKNKYTIKYRGWDGLCQECSAKERGKRIKGTKVSVAKPLYIDVQCMGCDKPFMKNRHTVSFWSGLCKECYHHSENGLWKGGITPENQKIRASTEYKQWRKSIFERDDFRCQICGDRGCYIEADHILPFSIYPEFRFELDNGRTLCEDCHYKFGWRKGRSIYNPLLHNSYVYFPDW